MAQVQRHAFKLVVRQGHLAHLVAQIAEDFIRRHAAASGLGLDAVQQYVNARNRNTFAGEREAVEKHALTVPRIAPAMILDRLGEWRRFLRQSTSKAARRCSGSYAGG